MKLKSITTFKVLILLIAQGLIHTEIFCQSECEYPKTVKIDGQKIDMLTADQSDYILKAFLYRDSLIKVQKHALYSQDSLCKATLKESEIELQKAIIYSTGLAANLQIYKDLIFSQKQLIEATGDDVKIISDKYKKKNGFMARLKRFGYQAGGGLIVGALTTLLIFR